MFGRSFVKHTPGLGHIWRMLGVLVVCTLAPLGLGLWLDRRFGTTPLFLVSLAFVGIVAATIGIVRITGRALEALGAPPETGAGTAGPVNGKEDKA